MRPAAVRRPAWQVEAGHAVGPAPDVGASSAGPDRVLAGPNQALRRQIRTRAEPNRVRAGPNRTRVGPNQALRRQSRVRAGPNPLLRRPNPALGGPDGC
jgi:hypothetical protein